MDSSQSACVWRLVTMEVKRPRCPETQGHPSLRAPCRDWLRTFSSLNHSPASPAAEFFFFRSPRGLQSRFPRNPIRDMCIILYYRGFPGGPSGKETTCQCRRCNRLGFNPWVKNNPWRRAWPPTPVFLPEKSYGRRSLVDYDPKGGKE